MQENKEICWQMPVGAQPDETGVRFRVWAKDAGQIEVVIFDREGHETQRTTMRSDGKNYFVAYLENLKPGTRYMYRLDRDKLRPDPASRYQPEGAHGPSEIVDPRAFIWSASEQNWRGLPLEDMVIYEVHIGTATASGTFDAFIEKLDYVKWLGVTAIELMPVADFPGDRNWGYDGVNLFAPARAYGGPEALRRLVDAAHLRGLAVIQDVVYNHFGPDGNYLRDFSREYFTDKEKTPWGDAINFGSREVREFFIANALQWAHDYHMDGLRLDATHAILDHSEEHILKELAGRVHSLLPQERSFVIFAEDDRNEVNLIEQPDHGGIGLDALWADDFHHQIRSVLAGDNEGYFKDYTGKAEDIAETLNKGWFYLGQLSEVSGKKRGTDASHFDPPHFVYCIQNHDQIGNRAQGDRLNANIEPDAYRAAAALLLLSPYTPLLFQGQEWAAATPFLFFTDHNPELGKLITEGRRAEFSYFTAFNGAEVPDPQTVSTFEASKLNWSELDQNQHRSVLTLYRDLLAYHRDLALLKERNRKNFTTEKVAEDAIAMRYQSPDDSKALLVVVNLKDELKLQLEDQEITRPPAGMQWQLLLSTNHPKYGGEDDLDLVRKDIEKGQLNSTRPVTLVLQS